MRCVICGHTSGYNRAVIERFSGATLGGLCMNCEKDEFGNTLTYDSPSDGGGRCILCERDGHVSLPRYLPQTERRGDHLHLTSTIESTESAPSLCDEHFHVVTDGGTVEEVIVR